jgi:hypothetical protein
MYCFREHVFPVALFMHGGVLQATARRIAAVSYRAEIRAMMKAGTLDEED